VRHRRRQGYVPPPTPGLRVTLANNTAAGTMLAVSAFAGDLAVQLDAATLAASFTSTTPVGQTATFTAQPASWHTRPIAAREGVYGPTRSGLYWLIAGDGIASRYVWWSHDDGTGRYCGIDPGTYVAALSGLTGIEVQLASGNRTAAQVATSTRSALTTAGVYTTIGGTGAVVSVLGSITAASCTRGGMYGSSTRGQAMTRRNTAQYSANPLDGAIGQFGVWAGGSVIVKSIGIYLAATTTPMRLALYTGGTSASLSGTTLLGEAYVASGGAVGWNWGALTRAATLTNGNFRLVASSNGTSRPGYVINSDRADSDWPDAGGGSTYNLEVYASTSRNPATPYAASLSGETNIDPSNGVYAMLAFEWIAADGTSGVFTTRIGVQPGVAATDLAQTSSLTVPDAGGADLYMGTPNPGLLGMEAAAWGVAVGTQHSTQARGIIACGSSIGNAEGADVLWQAPTTGSGTNAWLELAISAGVAIPSTGPLWWGMRNNATTFNLRFALNADRVQATPDNNPADWVDASEFEIFRSVNGNGTGGNVHTTDPSVAVATPVNDDGAAVATNTNYPGSYLVVRIPADEVA
jgi:hypothetical protein